MKKLLIIFFLLTGCAKDPIEFSCVALEWKSVSEDGTIAEGKVYPDPENTVPQGASRIYANLTLKGTVTDDIWVCVAGEGSHSWGRDRAMRVLFLKRGTILTGKQQKNELWAYGIPGMLRVECKEHRQVYGGGF